MSDLVFAALGASAGIIAWLLISPRHQAGARGIAAGALITGFVLARVTDQPGWIAGGAGFLLAATIGRLVCERRSIHGKQRPAPAVMLLVCSLGAAAAAVGTLVTR